MITNLLLAACLVVITVAIHTAGFSLLIRGVIGTHALDTIGFRRVTTVTIIVTCWLTVIHLVEIIIWGLFYVWQGCMPDISTALYFSGVTYTTLGYGDIVLPGQWRFFAPLEALTGILMCGLSTGLFFAWANHFIRRFMENGLGVKM